MSYDITKEMKIDSKHPTAFTNRIFEYSDQEFKAYILGLKRHINGIAYDYSSTQSSIKYQSNLINRLDTPEFLEKTLLEIENACSLAEHYEVEYNPETDPSFSDYFELLQAKKTIENLKFIKELFESNGDLFEYEKCYMCNTSQLSNIYRHYGIYFDPSLKENKIEYTSAISSDVILNMSSIVESLNSSLGDLSKNIVVHVHASLNSSMHGPSIRMIDELLSLTDRRCSSQTMMMRMYNMLRDNVIVTFNLHHKNIAIVYFHKREENLINENAI